MSGMIAADPGQGGAVWAVLQYVLGFQQLGHEVYLVEPLAPAALQPGGVPLGQSANARYFQEVVTAFGLENATALLLAGTQETVGLPYARLREIAARADLLVNISGMLGDEELTTRIPLRVYLDLDPAFNQLWQVAEGIDMRFGGHTHFVTVGQAIGRPGCTIPTGNISWLPTRPPVVLGQWPVAQGLQSDELTTVANWRGYGSIDYGGVLYGQKAHSLRELIDLPTRTTERFLLALAIHPDERRDLAALEANGWRLLDPADVASTPGRYRAFVQGSRAEFGIAKKGYVAARCGWFSDRSVCYLASGRPVVAQETGFSDFLPTGDGLFTFETADDVLASIQTIRADYPRQRRAARVLAEEYFDSDKVLSGLLRRVGAAP